MRLSLMLWQLFCTCVCFNKLILSAQGTSASSCANVKSSVPTPVRIQHDSTQSGLPLWLTLFQSAILSQPPGISLSPESVDAGSLSTSQAASNILYSNASFRLPAGSSQPDAWLTDRFVTSSDITCTGSADKLCRQTPLLIPLLGTGLVVVYNVPGMASSELLTWSPSLIVSALTGATNRWNDSALSALNPSHNLSAVNHSMTFLFSQHVGTLSTVQSVVETLAHSTSVTWPWNSGSTVHSVNYTSEVQVLFAIADTPYSWALVRYEEVLKRGYSLVARMKNAAGTVTSISERSVQAAISAVTTITATDTSVTSVLNHGGTDSYPLTLLQYMILPLNTHGDAGACARVSGIFTLLRWVITSGGFLTGKMASFGYYLPPVRLQDIIAIAIRSISCDGVSSSNSVTVTASGASFPALLYSDFIFAYTFVDPTMVLTYNSIGSGGGKSAILARTVDFAGSDSLLSDAQYAAGGDLSFVPACAGAVVPIFNIPAIGNRELRIPREVLPLIFLGDVRKWNDARIVAANPALASLLPDSNITVVHRSDRSGTTEIFSKALYSFSTEWASRQGQGSELVWLVDAFGGIGRSGSSGISSVVVGTPNSIGYVVLDYALRNSLQFALVSNKAGFYVAPSLASIGSAMSDFSNTGALIVDLMDAPGNGSFPIAGYSYYIYRNKTMTDCSKALKMLQYMQWTVSDVVAGSIAERLGFATLSTPVTNLVVAELRRARCQGNLILGSCTPGYVFSSTLDACAPCPPGQSSSGTGACFLCPPGSSSVGGVVCSPCAAGTFQPNAGQTSCVSCPALSQGPVGSVNVTQCLCLQGASLRTPSQTTYDNSVAVAQGADFPLCIACPTGASCAGGLTTPIPTRGFWASLSDPNNVIKCEVPALCQGGALGSAACPVNHGGSMCIECDSDFYFSGSKCVECPNDIVLMVVVAVTSVFVLIVAPPLIARRRLMAFGITATFLQTTTVLYLVRVGMPGSLDGYLKALSPMWWVLWVLSPECSMNADFFTRWAVRALAPVLILVLMGIFVLLVTLYHKVCPCARENAVDEARHTRRDTITHAEIEVPVCYLQYAFLTSGVSAAATQMYIFFSQAALEFFDCTERDAGTFTLDAEPSVECYTGRWNDFLPVGILSVALNLVAIPVGLFVVLRISEGATNRIKWNAMFGFIYSRYRPEHHYWELFVIARKVAVFVCVLFLSQRPSVVCALLVMLTTFSALVHAVLQPFVLKSAAVVDQILHFVQICVCALLYSLNTSEVDSNAMAAIMMTLITVGLVCALCYNALEVLSSFGIHGRMSDFLYFEREKTEDREKKLKDLRSSVPDLSAQQRRTSIVDSIYDTELVRQHSHHASSAYAPDSPASASVSRASVQALVHEGPRSRRFTPSVEKRRLPVSLQTAPHPDALERNHIMMQTASTGSPVRQAPRSLMPTASACAQAGSAPVMQVPGTVDM